MPQYYQLNASRLTFSECRRFSNSLFGAVFTWIFTRSQGPSGRMPFPSYDEIEAQRSDFSDALRPRMDELIKQFGDQGFAPVGFQKIPSAIDDSTIDSASAILLSKDHELVGTASLLIAKHPTSPGGQKLAEAIGISFTNTSGNVVSVGNMMQGLDPRPGNITERINTKDMKTLLASIKDTRRSYRQKVKRFDGWADLRRSMEDDAIATHKYRCETRGVFVPIE
jgi:hypothetical protein